ncbi:MAG TPA: ABC transporter ATP-binding protein, partial [Candidatus Limnocylindria bacterium]|nr:ABC transporter ATP-binding protein [Candidatus Limnocylindria bacterium]
TAEATRARSIDILDTVGIANAEGIYQRYPHELSGGMRQRVMIAMALVCNPALIIADEPTTALDVTLQAQILDLLRSLKDKINSSIMLITHDLGVVAEMADFVVVMYAGKIVEQGTAREVFLNPRHPYTVGLMASKPAVSRKVERLYSIPGSVPNPIDMPSYCYFKDRCDLATDVCDGEYPSYRYFSPSHCAACHNAEEINNAK